jgi:dTDP-4-amino-4,6-dideoxygalactose transaminase
MPIEYENLAKTNQSFHQDFKAMFEETLYKGQFILGNQVRNFEESWANYCNTNFAIGVNSGLDALTLALIALDLPPQSEIIVPSHTFIATILSVLQAGHQPVLVEPHYETYNIDESKIEEQITSKTKAIVVVHLYGTPCEMKPIQDICHTRSLYLLEDAAQAHGATYQNQKTGSLGDLASFSFYPAKNLGALGDAGAVVGNDDKFAQKISLLRNYGSKEKYNHIKQGFNSRLDELQASFLNIKLKALDAINAHKRHLASLYQAGLKEDFMQPKILPQAESVYHIFAIMHPERDRLREYLLKNGIQTGLHYPIAIPEQKAFEGKWNINDYPISAEIAKTQLSLPIAYFHQKSDVEHVIEVMNTF